EELAEAQKRTEERIEELAEAQKRTEQRIEELAEAQKRTEQRIEELAEAQKRTEERIEELAEAQKRTEEELRLLTREVHKIKVDLENVKDQLGALANTVGYTLENEAYKYLPKLLKKCFQIEVLDELKRDFIEIAPQRFLEVNIIGKARKNGQEVVLIGESKVQLRISHIKDFLKRLEKLKSILKTEVIPLLVCHQATPEAKKFCQDNGVLLFFSYQFK
ncbi:MAG: chordopoxvirus fusion protein, partial [Caldimicrobium sp.]|nr:chordopoxvirus fusion protein [Caldimicrobium sp.]